MFVHICKQLGERRMSKIEFNTYITDAEDIFNRICNKKVGNVIGSII